MGQGAWGGVTTKTLGSISYNTPTWEEDTGGIYEVEVDDSLVSEVETTPVGVVSTSSRKMSQTVLIAKRAKNTQLTYSSLNLGNERKALRSRSGLILSLIHI